MHTVMTDRDRRPGVVGARAGRGAVALGVSTFVGNVLAYGYSFVMSRALGPADFGALAALISIAVVGAVPATALQTQLARLSARSPASAALQRQGVRAGWHFGWAIGAAVALLAWPIAVVLHLVDVAPVLGLAASLVPTTALGARQGLLLGRGRLAALGALLVAVPGLRVAGALIAAATDSGVAGAMLWQAVAMWLGVAVAAILTGWPPPGAARPPEPRLEARPLLSAALGLLGLYVLVNLDVLLARAHLAAVDSGLYAVGALASKVVFWGTQFLALLVFPQIARGQAGRMMRGAVLLIGGIGCAGAFLAVALAEPVLVALVGEQYADAAGPAPWFVVLGALQALVQLCIYAAVAADSRRFAWVIWVGVAALFGAVTFVAHGSLMQVLLTAVTVTAALAAYGLWSARAVLR